MIGSQETNHQETAIKVLRTRRNPFVEFEFQWGDPDLAVPGTLMRGRLFEADIFTERFVTAGDASRATRSPLFKRL